MTPKHVKEAYRLLNKSIIRVDQPDIHLDEDENEIQDEMEVDNPDAAGDRAVVEVSLNYNPKKSKSTVKFTIAPKYYLQPTGPNPGR